MTNVIVSTQEMRPYFVAGSILGRNSFMGQPSGALALFWLAACINDKSFEQLRPHVVVKGGATCLSFVPRRHLKEVKALNIRYRIVASNAKWVALTHDTR